MRPRKADRDTWFVRSLDGDYFVLREIAEQLNVPLARVRRLVAAHPELRPTREGLYGSKWMDLFTLDQVAAITDHLSRTPRRPAGTRQLWSVSEYRDRQRRDNRVRYWRRRAVELDGLGEAAAAVSARAQADHIAAGLVEQRRARERTATGGTGRRHRPAAVPR